MNQTFSLSRFGRLLGTYLVENRTSLVSNAALLMGVYSVLAIGFYRGLPSQVDWIRYVLFVFIGWTAWYVFTVRQVAVLNEKEQAITYLLRPASLFEKYLLILFVSGLGFIAVYALISGLIDTVGVWYVNSRDWTPDELRQNRQFGGPVKLKSLFAFNALHKIPSFVWVISALLHGTALAFALVIRRYALPLAALVVIGLILVGILLNDFIVRGMLGPADTYSGLPFSDVSVIRNQAVWPLPLPQPIGNLIRYAVATLVGALLYLVVYFKLREREV